MPDHPDLGHCWVWQRCARDGRGKYPGVYFDGKMRSGHVIAHKMWNGPVLHPMTVDHKCWNTFCLRPSHLQLLTRAENAVADHGRGDMPGSRTKCKRQGHPFDETNTYIEPKTGYRQCATCKTENGKRYRTPEYKASRAERDAAAVLAAERSVELKYRADHRAHAKALAA